MFPLGSDAAAEDAATFGRSAVIAGKALTPERASKKMFTQEIHLLPNTKNEC